jgi:thiamine transport system permease protein
MTSARTHPSTDPVFHPVVGPGAAFIPVAWLVAFLVVPVVLLVTGDTDFDDVTRILTRRSTWNVVWFATWQAVLSVVATFVVAGPVTWLISRHRFRGRRALRAVTTVGFLLPSVVVATAFLAVLPRSLHYSVFAVVIAHAYFNIAVVVRVVGARAESLDAQLWLAAQTLGATPPTAWRTITVPMLRNSIASAGTVVFLYCFSSYAVIRVLGGPRRSTIESDIALRAFGIGDVGGASVLALLQMLCIGVVAGAIHLLARSNGKPTRAPSAMLPTIPDNRRRTAIAIAAVTVAFVIAPLSALFWQSVHVGDTVSARAWQSIFNTSLIESVWTSTRTALVAGLVGTVLCILATLAITRLRTGGNVVNSLTLAPLAMSPVTIGLGLLVTFDSGWFDWRSRWWFVALAHTLVSFPLAVRVLVPAWRTTPVGLHRAAAVLGAGGGRRFIDIDLRRMRPAIVASLGLVVAVSLGEFGAASMLSREGAETIPVAIARLLSRTGDEVRAQAFALASILVVVCVMALAIVEMALQRGEHASRR